LRKIKAGGEIFVAVATLVVGAVALGPQGGGTVRLRLYTNKKGIDGIQKSRMIQARDKGKVLFDRASGKPMSQHDAEKAFGIRRGHGRNIVETDVPADVSRVWNEGTRS
jgi:hypothetical protein